MENVVYQDTPLATYLAGAGEGLPSGDETEDESKRRRCTTGEDAVVLDDHYVGFAPARSSEAYVTCRKRIPKALKLHARGTSRSLSQLHHAASGMVKGQLGPRQNATFLERFRYAIVISDLLSEHNYGHHGYSKPEASNQGGLPPVGEISKPVFSALGMIGVAGAAFVLAGSIAWARSVAHGSGSLQLLLVVGYIVIGGVASFAFARRKWLQHVRTQAVDDVSAFVANAQAFDASLSAAVTIVQEVELVARGYRISAPLPPVSRMDDHGQQRRCARLRSAVCRATQDILQPLAETAIRLDKHTVRNDLERYHDIYEITRSEIDEVKELALPVRQADEDGESLKALKLAMHQLFLSRKLLLCNLLAVDADGTASDFLRWTLVASSLQALSSKYLEAAVRLDDLLSDEERFATPVASKPPLTPSRERVRTQIRKLGGLSSGIRSLQAKMHMLREEADRGLDSSDDSGELSRNLLTQYDAIGADLRLLLQEWEEGRTTLLTSHNKRRSVSSAGLLSPRAETPSSLSGSTAMGGSPSDAFRVLNGDMLSPRLDVTSSDEEVFEAVALPRQRSALSREERIAKMKEDKETREKARESQQASTNMLRELEMVLKYKPQGSKAARRVTVM